jgi:hypothetical protein
MNCEDVVELLGSKAARGTPEAALAAAHAAACVDCRSALQALEALKAARTEPVPMPPPDAFERALHHALQRAPAPRRSGFWRGAAFGAALAAGLTAVAVGVWLGRAAPPSAVPEVRLAMNEPRNVTVELDAPEPLERAELHVELRGAIGLDGYDDQRDLRWSTDLDRGANQLTLPLVVRGERGGQLLVEVLHGERRRTFVIDVRAGRTAEG